MLKFWLGHEDHEGPQRARKFVLENHGFKNLKYQEGREGKAHQTEDCLRQSSVK